ncbi:MAG TPA: hypothetical protein VFX86_04785 [Candidatus Saccharimonadales bacterium]|nr:hypothetical protein [Candidatus Saccharimonadales bacterium]
MESAGSRPPSFSSDPEKVEQGQSSYSLKTKIGAAAATGATILVCAIAGIKAAHEFSDEPKHDSMDISKAYAPAGEFDDSSPTPNATEKAMVDHYFAEGHETGLLPPDEDTRAVYRDVFSNPEVGISKNIPGLREVAYLQDENIFRPEYQNYLNVYPFIVFNNTRHPVDLMYINYAVRATKAWLNAEVRRADGVVIGQHTETMVEPRAVPHRLVMTSKIPPGLREDLPKSDGVTIWNPLTEHEHPTTDSFVRNSGPVGNPFEPWIVGTEICQALVNVYDQKVLPDREREQRDVQNFVSTFNEDARDDIDLATQESLCNTLGRHVAAAYFGGKQAVDELPSDDDEVGKTSTLWLDYEPFQPLTSRFIRLANNIRAGGSVSTIIATKSARTPSSRFYRRSDPDVNLHAIMSNQCYPFSTSRCGA